MARNASHSTFPVCRGRRIPPASPLGLENARQVGIVVANLQMLDQFQVKKVCVIIIKLCPSVLPGVLSK